MFFTGQNGKDALVNPEQALVCTRQFPEVPPPGTQNRFRFFIDTMKDVNGEDRYALVPGNRDNVPEMTFEADPDFQTHVMAIQVVIGDGTVRHDRFGNLIINNDFRIILTNDKEDNQSITVGKTGGQLLLTSGMFEPYGYTDTTNELVNHFSTTDAQTILIPLWQMFPDGRGFVLPQASDSAKISLFYVDDFAALDAASSVVRVMGYRRYPIG